MALSRQLALAYICLFVIWLAPLIFTIPVPANLLALTVVIIFLGSHRSLVLRDQTIVPVGERDRITQEDALKFPLVGSAVLFGLFLVLKLIDKELVNLLLTIYFCGIGLISITTLVEPILMELFVSKKALPLKEYGSILNLPVFGKVPIQLNWIQGVGVAISTPIVVQYFLTKHFLLNNLLGIAFCVDALGRISLGSYKAGAILLSGLFFYDIFWVFGTDKILTGDSVMVTVAKSLDIPIKLLFPKTVDAAPSDFSLLGLGDIVIPGLLIALLLRFDAERANADVEDGPNGSFHKPFFLFTLLAYAAGMGCTLAVMEYFKAAQPALLYLVPACLGTSLLAGLLRSQLTDLLGYDDGKPAQDMSAPPFSSAGSSSVGAAGTRKQLDPPAIRSSEKGF